MLVRAAISALLVLPDVAVAQSPGDSLARRTVDLEFGGPGGFISVNYEQLLRPQTLVRVGFAKWSVSTFLFDDGHHRQTAFIAGAARLFDLSWLPQQDGVWVETGINMAAGRRSYDNASTRESGPFISINGEIGLRLQGTGRSSTLRAMLGPSYVLRSSVHEPRPGLTRAVAVSLGYAF